MPIRPGLLATSRAPQLLAALCLAAAACSALVPRGAPLENCLHLCAGNRACEYECREDAGEDEDVPAARATGSATGIAVEDPAEDGELVSPPSAR